MNRLEEYLQDLKDRKGVLIKKRLPVVDTDCPVQKITRRTHNAKLKYKIDSLNICILSVENYQRRESEQQESTAR